MTLITRKTAGARFANRGEGVFFEPPRVRKISIGSPSSYVKKGILKDICIQNLVGSTVSNELGV